MQEKKLDENMLWRLSTFYRVFGDETRLNILYLLLEKAYCVSEISQILNVSASAVSHQLRTLRQLRLVVPKKSGKEVYYTLCDEHIQIILKYGIEHVQEENIHEEV